MAGGNGIIGAFLNSRKTGKASVLAQGMKLITPPCQQFVRIGLMADIPD